MVDITIDNYIHRGNKPTNITGRPHPVEVGWFCCLGPGRRNQQPMARTVLWRRASVDHPGPPYVPVKIMVLSHNDWLVVWNHGIYDFPFSWA